MYLFLKKPTYFFKSLFHFCCDCVVVIRKIWSLLESAWNNKPAKGHIEGIQDVKRLSLVSSGRQKAVFGEFSMQEFLKSCELQKYQVNGSTNC